DRALVRPPGRRHRTGRGHPRPGPRWRAADRGPDGLRRPRPPARAGAPGGTPVSCAAALAVLATIEGEGLLDHVKRVGERLRRGIEPLPLVSEVRGARRVVGVVFTAPVRAARG